jgi:hypothetical protein
MQLRVAFKYEICCLGAAYQSRFEEPERIPCLNKRDDGPNPDRAGFDGDKKQGKACLPREYFHRFSKRTV